MPKKQEKKPDCVWGNLNIEQAITLWQTGIKVEQHFNDICIKIRNFANAFVSVFFSTVFLILTLNYKNAGETNQSALIYLDCFILMGQAIWGILWFKDRFWYHTFLIGAVRFCENIEKKIFDIGEEGITHMISTISHVPVFFSTKNSDRAFFRLDFFYISISSLMFFTIFLINFLLPKEKNLTCENFILLVLSILIPIAMFCVGRRANKKFGEFENKKKTKKSHP